MVGQEVKLQVAAASPYTDVPAGVTWAFDSPEPSDVVAFYGLNPAVTVPDKLSTPEPISVPGLTAIGTGPIAGSVYWIRAGVKHVHVTASLAGQSTATDFYYKMDAPTKVSATAATSVVSLNPSYNSGNNGGVPICTPVLIALSLGTPCDPVAGSDLGINWTYTASNSDQGSTAGTIAWAQTVQSTYSGIAVASPTTSPTSSP
jgi:hypothetical protein